MRKRSLRLISALTVLLGLALLAACSAKASGDRVQWHGLCIPKAKVSHLNSSSPFGKILSQTPMDKTSSGWITVEFGPDEMMKAIPGWTGYVPSPDGGPKLRKLLVVGLSSDNPVNTGRLTNILRELYSLRGPYKEAKITEIGSSGLYRVQSSSEDGPLGFWSLLLVDPKSAQKPPVESLHRWYAGDCMEGDQRQRQETTCDLTYVKQGLAFDFTLSGQNIKYARAVEAFLAEKVRQWRAACKAKPQ